MDLSEAAAAFAEILRQIKPECKAAFVDFVENETSDLQPSKRCLPVLEKARKWLTPQLNDFGDDPANPSPVRYTADGTPIFVVDGFIRSDDEIDELMEKKLLPAAFCLDCRSMRTKPVDHVSHSFNPETVVDIFNKILTPDVLAHRRLVDIGCRLAPVLIGAARVAPPSTTIVGIEKDPFYAKLGAGVIAHTSPQRQHVHIVCADVFSPEGVAAIGSGPPPGCPCGCAGLQPILLLHNVFEYFYADTAPGLAPGVTATAPAVDPAGLPTSAAGAWERLIAILHAGTIVVASPSVEESLRPLGRDLQAMAAAHGRSWARGAKVELDQTTLYCYSVSDSSM